jgi:hypothetical protein
MARPPGLFSSFFCARRTSRVDGPRALVSGRADDEDIGGRVGRARSSQVPLVMVFYGSSLPLVPLPFNQAAEEIVRVW